MKIRYVGPDASRDLAVPGALLVFPRMKWLDPAALCTEANVPPAHLEIVLRDLGDDWERDEPKQPRTKNDDKEEQT